MIEGSGPVQPVSQARMVAQNAIADDLGHDGIAPLRQITQDLRAGRGMVDRLLRALQASLKRRIVLSEVVEKPREKGRPFKAEKTHPVSRLPRNGEKVFLQKLPIGFIRPSTRMCIIGHALPQ